METEKLGSSRMLRVSLVSSFTHGGLRESLRQWPDVGVAVEPYLFMPTDQLLRQRSLFRVSKLRWIQRVFCDYLIPIVWQLPGRIPIQLDRHQSFGMRFGKRRIEPISKPEVSISEWLGSRCKNSRYIAECAEEMANLLREREVPAVSTFTPEILADGKGGWTAVNALRFVLQLVSELNSRYKAKIRIVNIVCGGVVDRLRCLPERDKQSEPGEVDYTLEGDRLPFATAHKKLINVLKELVDELSEGVTLALKLDAGPIFGVAHWKHLTAMNAMLIEDDRLNRCVGFNCNISEWGLSGVRPEMIRSNPRGPFSRIVHAHLSDCGFGRFSCLRPRVVNSAKHFKEWISLVREAYEQPQNRDRCSGYVSVELELAASQKEVKRAVAITRNLVS